MIYTQRFIETELLRDVDSYPRPDQFEIEPVAFVSLRLRDIARNLQRCVVQSGYDDLGHCYIAEFVSGDGNSVIKFIDYPDSPRLGTVIAFGSSKPVDIKRTLPGLLHFFNIPISSLGWAPVGAPPSLGSANPEGLMNLNGGIGLSEIANQYLTIVLATRSFDIDANTIAEASHVSRATVYRACDGGSPLPLIKQLAVESVSSAATSIQNELAARDDGSEATWPAQFAIVVNTMAKHVVTDPFLEGMLRYSDRGRGRGFIVSRRPTSFTSTLTQWMSTSLRAFNFQIRRDEPEVERLAFGQMMGIVFALPATSPNDPNVPIEFENPHRINDAVSQAISELAGLIPKKSAGRVESRLFMPELLLSRLPESEAQDAVFV